MYLNRQNPHGGDIYKNAPDIDFSASLNPMGMPEPVRRALRASVEKCTAYPDPYCRDLRAAIGKAEGVPEGRILCGAGASELLYAYALALPGDRPALVVAPAFSEYTAALKAAGKRVEAYVLSSDNGFHLTGDILSVDLSGYCAVFVCSPANPTGIAVGPELIEALCRTGVRLLLDLCFLDLTADPGRYHIPSLIARFPNVSVLRSPTKSFAIPGVRLGYLLSSDVDLLERMSERGQCWNVSVPAQMAGVAAMECGEWLCTSVQTIAAERRRLSSELGMTGLAVYPGEANFLLIKSDEDLAKPLAERGIAVRDCSNFTGLSRGYYRIAVRTRAENDRFIAAVREVLS